MTRKLWLWFLFVLFGIGNGLQIMGIKPVVPRPGHELQPMDIRPVVPRSP